MAKIEFRGVETPADISRAVILRLTRIGRLHYVRDRARSRKGTLKAADYVGSDSHVMEKFAELIGFVGEPFKINGHMNSRRVLPAAWIVQRMIVRINPKGAQVDIKQVVNPAFVRNLEDSGFLPEARRKLQ